MIYHMDDATGTTTTDRVVSIQDQTPLLDLIGSGTLRLDRAWILRPYARLETPQGWSLSHDWAILVTLADGRMAVSTRNNAATLLMLQGLEPPAWL